MANTTQAPASTPIALAALAAPVSRTPGLLTRLRRNTPALALLAGLAIVAASVLAGSIAYGALRHMRQTVQVMAHDAKPSVVAALRIRSDLGAMDAGATLAALGSDGQAVGLLVPYLDATRALEADMLAAARNVTYGRSEVEPLLRLARSVADYHQALGKIRGSAILGNPVDIRSRVMNASGMLNADAIPAAADLQQANLLPMLGAFSGFESSSGGAPFIVGLSLLLALAAVLAAQVFAFRKLGHRVLQPGLVLATLALMGSMAVVPLELGRGRAAVHRAKLDAFDSIVALHETKTVVDHMNAAQSLWLLLPPAEHDIFLDRSFAVGAAAALQAGDADSANLTGRFADRAKAAVALSCDRGDEAAAQSQTPEFGGLLGRAMGNITYGCDERRPVTEAVSAFLDFMAIDRTMRDLTKAGRVRDAVTVAMNTERGGSAWAYNRLQSALDQAIAINDTAFNREIAAAERMLDRTGHLLDLALLIVVLLSAGELWFRTKEYR